MTTHFVCQPTEPLAHKYPVVQKVEKSHGAVSSYECFNMGSKAHTKFPPPGWDMSLSSEESLPLCQPPAPSWKHQLSEPDPSLTLTPEKPVSQLRQKHFYPAPMQYQPGLTIIPDPDLCITPDKTDKHKSNIKNLTDGNHKSKQKVRFDMPSSDSDKENKDDSSLWDGSSSPTSKHYSPADYSGNEVEDEENDKFFVDKKTNEENYSITHFGNGEKNLVPFKSYKNLPEVLSLDEAKNSSKKSGMGCTFKIVKEQRSVQKDSKKALSSNDVLKKTNIPSDKSLSRKVRVTRESEARLQKNAYNFPFDDRSDTKLEFEHALNRPEFNSTLRVRKELECLKECMVDVSRAVEKKLAKKEGLMNDIQEKAALLVNQLDNKYSGLVSLEVPLEDIKTAAEVQKSAKVKPKRNKQAESGGREPDIMEFFSSEMQQEFLNLSIPGVNPPNEQLQIASTRSTFDLYKHNRVWSGNSNFKCDTR